MVILGIDPGSVKCGYALLEVNNRVMKLVEAGFIHIKTKGLQYQIAELMEGLDTVVKGKTVDQVAMEDIFYANNPQSVLKLAQIRGALALKIIQEFGNFAEYTPLQVKKAVTGNGKAQKEQVAYMVRTLLGIKKEIKPLDVTDAIAVAVTHGQRVNLPAPTKAGLLLAQKR